MGKRKWIFIGILMVLFAILVFAESNRKKPLNWNLSFSGKSRNPYGSFVLKKLLKETYADNNFSESNDGIFLYRKYNPYISSTKFIYITQNFNIDKYELIDLLSFIERGNDVFIAAEYFSKSMRDSLGLNMGDILKGFKIPKIEKNEMRFTNADLSQKKYEVSFDFTNAYFSSVDTARSIVMGTYADSSINYIKMNFGKGNLYLNTNPMLFTNYNILYGNEAYPFTALSFLQGNSIVWDEFYKPDKTEISSPIRYILSQPALKVAYILIIIGVIIYLLFGGKRRQRIVPVIQAPENKSLEFAHILGRLYFNNRNNKDIALKKYAYFCEYIRTKYHVRDLKNNTEFYQQLSERSGVNTELIALILKLAEYIQTQSWTGDNELMSLNSNIEEFYAKTK